MSTNNSIATQYQVYDRHTGLSVGKPSKTLKAASSKVDRLDNIYGGYRYGYKAVELKV